MRMSVKMLCSHLTQVQNFNGGGRGLTKAAGTKARMEFLRHLTVGCRAGLKKALRGMHWKQ